MTQLSHGVGEGGGVAAGAGANFDPFFDSQMKAEVKSNQYKHKYQHRTKILHYGVDDPNLTKVRGAGLGGYLITSLDYLYMFF